MTLILEEGELIGLWNIHVLVLQRVPKLQLFCLLTFVAILWRRYIARYDIKQQTFNQSTIVWSYYFTAAVTGG